MMRKTKIVLILFLLLSIFANGVFVYALVSINYNLGLPKPLTNEEINIVHKTYPVLLRKELFPVGSYLQKIENGENEIVLHFMVLDHLRSHSQIFGGFVVSDGCSSFRFSKEYEFLDYKICG